MGHARRYQEDQPELAVWCLLDGVNAFFLCLGVFQQYLWGGDWLLDVNLPGPKLVSGCGFQKFTSSLRPCGVGVIADSRRGLTETLFAFGNQFHSLWQAFSRVGTKKQTALKYKFSNSVLQSISVAFERFHCV